MAGSPAPVGRFAPTPSGRMHLGNVFASLLAWLSIRSQGGRILMRIEDLDPLRSGEPHTSTLLRDMEWLGLTWDAVTDRDSGPGYEPGQGIWMQSRRTAFYEETLGKLEALGLVYPCFCSRAQLHAASAPHQSDGSYVYDGRCRGMPMDFVKEQSKTKKPALRLLTPDETIAFTDVVQGPHAENLAKECGDFILRRSDGIFSYQLAATADDGAMGVTEVVRGRDLLASTPRQIWLLRLLGYAPPRYCHVPLLLAPDGRRLAKRDLDLDLGILREKHRHPQTIVGKLAHLAGLVPTPKPIEPEALVAEFDWRKVRKQDIVIQGEYL